jgi:hypothetical protein
MARIITYNCRSLKNSRGAIQHICEENNICCIQEQWLREDAIPLLSKIHDDCNSDGVSVIDTNIGLLAGRSFGGVDVLWRRSMGRSVCVIKYDNRRIVGLELYKDKGNMLYLNVYLPTDIPDHFEDYIGYLDKLHAIIQDCATCNVVSIGDSDADTNAHFGRELTHCIYDIETLPVGTYT